MSTASTVAFTFPGQGSQDVGMGASFAEHTAGKAVFEEVDAALDQNLFTLMQNGPKEELTLTENAQPALMACSLAALRVLEAETGKSLQDLAGYVAGHSLGEYSALAAAGTFTLADTARLLKTRGQAMQSAVPVGEGAMAALLNIEFDKAKEAAERASTLGVCQIANDNGAGQLVLSGAKPAVEKAMEYAQELGARRAVLLDVSAPFHCALMQPAADAMKEALASVDAKAPVVPLISNVLAEAITDPVEIKTRLVEQVTGTVRWHESVVAMKAKGVSTFYELGSGKVLSGLARRIDRDLGAIAVNTVDDVKKLTEALA